MRTNKVTTKTYSPSSVRTWFVHATCGGGHKHACSGVFRYIVKKHPEKEKTFEQIDILDFCIKPLRYLYSGTYDCLVRNAPWMWGVLYHISNKKIPFTMIAPFRFLVNVFLTAPFIIKLIKEKPACIFTTHFLSTYIISLAKKFGRLKSKLIVNVTDYRAHRFWANKEVDMYFVACSRTGKDLLECGIDENKICVTGISVREKFYEFALPLDTKYSLELKLKKATIDILLMSGGNGVGPVKRILQQIVKTSMVNKVVVICGHNEKLITMLEQMLTKMPEAGNKDIKIIGYTDQIPELMSQSKLLITKAGGLSVTETMVSGLASIIHPSQPGQEALNMLYFVEQDMSIFVKRTIHLKQTLEDIFRSDKLEKMTRACLHNRKLNTLEEITKYII